MEDVCRGSGLVQDYRLIRFKKDVYLVGCTACTGVVGVLGVWTVCLYGEIWL